MLRAETSVCFRLFDNSFNVQCTNVYELRQKLCNDVLDGVPAQCIWNQKAISINDTDSLAVLLEEYSRQEGPVELSVRIQVKIAREDSDALVECFAGTLDEIRIAANNILSRDEYTYDITVKGKSLNPANAFRLLAGGNVVTLTNIAPIFEEKKEQDAVHSELHLWLRSVFDSVSMDLLSSLSAAFANEGFASVDLLRSCATNGRSEVLALCSDIALVESVRNQGFKRGHKSRLVDAILALAGDEHPPALPPNMDPSMQKAVEPGLENACDEFKMVDSDVTHGIRMSLVPLPQPVYSITVPQPDGGINSPVAANLSVHIEVPETFIQLGPEEVVGTDVVCVVDVSGSMSQIALAGPDGERNKDGLSILDLVKHALKTVINQLDGNDRFAVVEFSTTAKRVFALRAMDEAGRERALAALESMHPQNSTNIWAGLLEGMEAIRDCTDGLEKVLMAGPPGLVEKTVVARRKTVMLLTDGQPNCEPPKGHLAELRGYLDKYPDFHFQLNTFGFGYQLNSDLLSELATECGGTFAFIPDALIVGTVFVNTMANAMSAFSQTATLNLIPKNGATIAELPGFNNACAQLNEWIPEGDRAGGLIGRESWGLRVKLGPLQLGQAREITVPLNGLGLVTETPGAPVLEAVLQFPHPVPNRGPDLGAHGRPCNVIMEISGGEIAEVIRPSSSTLHMADDALREAAAIGVLRNEFVAAIAGAIKDAVTKNGESAIADMDAVGKNLEGRYRQLLRLSQIGEMGEEGDDASESPLTALKADAEGRCLKALQGKDRFSRWGKHYLLAIARAHELRQCTNFMDPGLQIYGGEQFKNLRTKGDEMFLALPPPVKSSGPSGRSSFQAAQSSRSSYTRSYARAPARASAPAKAAPVNMGGYYAGLGGGCFGPESTVTRVGINGEETVRITAIRSGDRVCVADGSTAVVRCVVAIPRAAGKHFVEFAPADCEDFLAITPKHPVCIKGRWRLPRELVETEMDVDGLAVSVQPSDHVVFNLFLEEGKHSVLVGGVACATWGHGLIGDVIEHPLFGNYDRVAALLSQCVGWNQGLVCLESGGLVALGKKHDRVDARPVLLGSRVAAMLAEPVLA